jgi:hypothetical protein
MDYLYGYRKAYALKYSLKLYNIPDEFGILIDDNQIVKKGFEDYCKINKKKCDLYGHQMD